MEIQKCYETLELPPHATPADVHQAHKDLVNIWHPDRVQNNPRLKKRADEKLKEINVAYAELISFLSSGPKTEASVQKKSSQPPVYAPSPSDSKPSTDTETEKPRVTQKPGSDFLSNLWTLLNRAVDALVRMTEPNRDTIQKRPERFQPMGGPRQGRGMGRHAGRGRRGGMGRGKKR